MQQNKYQKATRRAAANQKTKTKKKKKKKKKKAKKQKEKEKEKAIFGDFRYSKCFILDRSLQFNSIKKERKKERKKEKERERRKKEEY